MYVGVYAKCEVEKIKKSVRVYGCSDHDSYSVENWRRYCSYCGKTMGFFEENVLVYSIKDNDIHPLNMMPIGNQLCIVSIDTEDGTNFGNIYDNEFRIDFSLMVDALLKFNSLYKEQLYYLSQYGKIEVHFGILND